MIGTFIWAITILILIMVLLSYFIKSIDNKKEFLKKYAILIIMSILLWFFGALIFQWNINLIVTFVISYLTIIILIEKRILLILKVVGITFLILFFVIYNCISFSTRSTLYLDNLNAINKIEYIDEFQYGDKTIVISKREASEDIYYYSFNIYDNLFNFLIYKNQSDHKLKYYEYNKYKDNMVSIKRIEFVVYPLNDNKYLFLHQYSNLNTSESLVVNNEEVEINGQDDKYVYIILDSIPDYININGEILNLKSR